MHQRMNEKRFRKFDAIAEETKDWYRTLGSAAAPRGIVAWGSMYGLMREWVLTHPEYRVFLPEIVHPFPIAALERWREGIEQGQLEFLIQFPVHRQYILLAVAPAGRGS